VKHITVVGAVILKNGQIFACKRGPNMSLAGLWEFPGGKVEVGESAPEALKREIEEELGCTIQVGEFVTTTDHQYDFGIVSLTTYLCEIIQGAPTLTEHSEERWLDPNDLHTVEWAPADVPAVELLVSKFS
jgi:8-oxo-dGTP diphosphatase